MRIHTLWKMWDDEGVELLFALDANTVEQNWQAWEDGCESARTKYDITDADTREAIIEIPYASIAAMFYAPEIEGDVVP